MSGAVDPSAFVSVSPSPAAWRPTAEIVAIGQAASVRYTYATRIAEGEDAQKPVSVGVRALRDALVPVFGVSSGGLERTSSRRHSVGQVRDLHEEARAIDFMVPAGSGRNPKGDAVASFLVRYAARLGVQAIIWRRVEWYTTSGPRWEAYAAADHDDHVHTEVTVEAARRSPAEVRAIVDAVLAEEARRTGGGAMVLGGEGIPGLGWFALAGVFATGMGAWALWRRRARRRLTMASYELGPGDGDGY